MAVNNVKTAFGLPSGVNEDFVRNLIWPRQQQQHQKILTNNNNKISSNSHQVYTQENVFAEVSFE